MSDPERLPRPPLVLLAHDQEWSARSLESILGPSGYAVLRAYTGAQALELALTIEPDLVILDSRLPDMSGIEVCRALRAGPTCAPSTPIVMTTSGPLDRDERLAAHRAGVWEIVMQPLDGEIFLHKLHVFTRSKREVDRLRGEGLLDADTGLYNMRGLIRRAHELSADAQRQRAPIACVAFAPVVMHADRRERTLDEGAGSVVARLGDVVRRIGRASDAIGRVGPTEFAVIAPDTAGPGAVRMVERFQEVLAADPVPLADAPHGVRIRAGYCAVPDLSESALDAVEMLLRANAALRHVRSGSPDVMVQAFESVPITSAS